MNKIFKKDNQWYAFEAPEQPRPHPESIDTYTGKMYLGGDLGDSKALTKWQKAYSAAKAAALSVLNDDEIWKYIKRPGIEGKDYDWPGTIEKVDECSEGEKCTGSDRTCNGSAVWYYELKLPNSAHSYTEGAETWSPEEVAKASALGNFILTGDYVQIAKAAVNNLSHRQQSFGYVAAKAYLENESLKQSLRELIPLAECTVIPDGPEKDMMKEIWPGTHSEMEKRQAAIDRAKSKLI